MDFLWVVGTIILIGWKIHKRYPCVVSYILIYLALTVGPVVIWGHSNEILAGILSATGICLTYPYIQLFLHCMEFHPQVIKERIEKIVKDKKWDIEQSVPSDQEIYEIVSDDEYFHKYYDQFFHHSIQDHNLLIDPESSFYYLKDNIVKQRATWFWRQKKIEEIDKSLDQIEAEYRRELDSKRWFKRKHKQTAPLKESKFFSDEVRERVQKIAPTNKQLAHFMSKRYVQNRNGAMKMHSQQEWIEIFSSDSQAYQIALSLWREECARRIIASGEWPNGFHE